MSSAIVHATESDEQLVRQARQGDRRAFGELVLRQERAVLAVALGMLGSWEDARDVAQDSFVTAYQKLNWLWLAKSFGPWVLQIARRRALRYRKHRGRRACLEIPADFPGEAHPASGPRMSEKLLACIARLPRQEQSVVMLRYLDGMPIAQIAKVSGRPMGTVTKQLSRAHERLRLWLGEVNDE